MTEQTKKDLAEAEAIAARVQSWSRLFAAKPLPANGEYHFVKAKPAVAK